MDPDRHHGTHHHPRPDILPIDLGNEPPLSVDGEDLVDRRRVSVQWFSGTILTGLCGAALMGGAVFASLDGQTNFASVPERMEAALRGALGNMGDRIAAVARKGDKLASVVESNVTRQVIRVSTATRVGDREVMRVRPMVRVTGNLSLTVSELSANIPPYNPQRMLADSGSSGTPGADAAAAEPEAEVSFVTRDLGVVLPRAKVAAALAIEDVLARVRDAANFTGSTARQALGIQQPDPVRLAYAAEGNPDPYAGFEARVVPENITLLPKTATQTTGGNAWNDRSVTLKKGDSIASVLRDLGVGADDIKAIAAVLGPRGRDGGLKEGQKLRILLATTTTGTSQQLQPVRIIVGGDGGAEAVVALSDMGKYVAVDVQSVKSGSEAVQASEDDDDEDDGTGVRLYQSVYESALRNQVPRPVIEDLVRIYSYDVDFQRKTQPGDSFEVMYAGDDEAGAEGKGDVLFAALTVGGESRKYFRYQTADDGVVDYYDETGKSAKKFLVRKPVMTAIMRSGFGVRRHPVLGYTKMHTGVDWAAPAGTPILASGNGTLEKVGWESGYGRYIRIRHTNGYETAYGHMTAFARNMQPGTKVRQGQVIGFVGSTGLATGAHLHYEILVNGRFVDPMRIKLPRGRVLDGPMLASFDKERSRIEGVMARGPTRNALAQPQPGG